MGQRRGTDRDRTEEPLSPIARAGGLPVTVHRPPRVVGDAATGAANFDDFLFLALRGAHELGRPPDIKWTERTAPVDFLAAAIAGLSARRENLGRCFHYLSGDVLHWSDLFAWCEGLGDPIAFADWKNLVKAAGPGGNALFPLLPVLDEFGEIADFPNFTADATDAALDAAGLPRCPAFDEAAAATHVARMRALGLLDRR